MVRIAVAGAAGRMGRRICALSAEFENLEVAGAFEIKGHPEIGKDIGIINGLPEAGVVIKESIEDVLDAVDVVIDFTHPDATMKNLEACINKGTGMVIGTTGLGNENIAKIREAGAKIPCVFAFNMSLGINLLTKVVEDVARALGDTYDVEVIEAHHRLKKDAPSGTAYMLARAAAQGLGRDLDKDGVFERYGMIGERGKKEIGVQTIRAGDIVGEHTVMFGGLGERIEITHRVSNRDTFARGALRAAGWLEGRGAGPYDMQDVLGLK